MIRRRAAVLLLLAILPAACANYDPPMAGDHTAPRYQADAARCRKQASAAAARTANATPQSALRAAFASDEPQREAVRSCMQSRGYALAAP